MAYFLLAARASTRSVCSISRSCRYSDTSGSTIGHTVECIAEADGLPIVTSFSTLPFLFLPSRMPPLRDRVAGAGADLPLHHADVAALELHEKSLAHVGVAVSAAMDEAFRTRAFTYFGAWCKTSRPVKRSVGLCWK